MSKQDIVEGNMKAPPAPCFIAYAENGDTLLPLALTRLSVRVDVAGDTAFVAVHFSARTPSELKEVDGAAVVPLGHAEAVVCDAGIKCKDRVVATSVVSKNDASTLGRGAPWLAWAPFLGGGDGHGEDSSGTPYAPDAFVLPFHQLPGASHIEACVRWLQPLDDATLHIDEWMRTDDTLQSAMGESRVGVFRMPLCARKVVTAGHAEKFALVIEVHHGATSMPARIWGVAPFAMSEQRGNTSTTWRRDGNWHSPWPEDVDLSIAIAFPPAPDAVISSSTAPAPHLGLRAQLITQEGATVDDAKGGGGGGGGGGAMHLTLAASREAPVFRRAVVFVVDRSGSMRGNPMRHAVQALFASIAQLTVGVDSFNVVAFDHEQMVFHHNACVLVTPDSIEACRMWAGKVLRARGLTDILTPLRIALRLLELHTNAERATGGEAEPLQRVVLVTDGRVVDEHSVVAYVSAQATSVRISCCGIGAAANCFFLKLLAEQARGACVLCLLEGATQMDVARLMSAAAAPAALANVSVELAFKRTGGSVLERIPLASLESYPSVTPDVPAGGSSEVYASSLIDGRVPVSATIRAVLADGTQLEAEVVATALPPARAGGDTTSPPLTLAFAKRRLDAHIARGWLAEGTPVDARASVESAKMQAAKKRAHGEISKEAAEAEALVVGTPVPPAYVASDDAELIRHRERAHANSMTWGIPAPGVASLIRFETRADMWSPHQSMGATNSEPPRTIATQRSEHIDPRTKALRGALGCYAVGFCAVGFGSVALTLAGIGPFAGADIGSVMDGSAFDGGGDDCCGDDCCGGDDCEGLDCADCLI